MTANKCQIINGKFYAEEAIRKLTSQVELLKKRNKLTPGLAVVMVGDDAASIIYTNNKARKAQEIGIHSELYKLNNQTSEHELLSLIKQLNDDCSIHGILVQLPLPPSLNTHNILNAISYTKDIDGFSVHNVGLLNSWQNCLEPCTPQGVLYLIQKFLGKNLSGKKAVILGRSQAVGRPMAAMLVRENCTVTIMHSHSHNPIQESRTADILISAIGTPRLINKEWVKEGACVIDVGIRRIDDKIYGDIDFQDVQQVADYLTPVPGGVGPMTIACLMSNTLKAACAQNNITLHDEIL